MNTVEKGDALENQVFPIIKELVESNAFFVNGKYSKVFQKKGYLSKETGELIIFDITIETYLPGANQYSSLIVIECKNYGSAIPVRAIQKFSDDLSQIGRDNTKGIVIANSNFQKGILKIAKSRGIGLARVVNSNELEWVSYRKQKDFANYGVESIEYEFEQDIPTKHFFSLLNDKIFENLPDLLIELGAFDIYLHKTKHLNVPYKTDEEIEGLLNEWPSHYFFKNGKLDTDELCQVVSQACEVDFNFETTLGSNGYYKLLGKLEFNPLKISIDKELRVDKFRWRYTLAHEIGHLVLHYELLSNSMDAYLDTDNTLSFYEDFAHGVNNRLEIQANRFASFLLLPKDLFLNAVYDYFKRNNIYKPMLTLDHQRVNMQLVFGLLNELQNKFDVSKEAAKLRLKKLNLLKDTTDRSMTTLLKDSLWKL